MFFVAKICKRALRASIEGYLAVAASTPTYSSLIVTTVNYNLHFNRPTKYLYEMISVIGAYSWVNENWAFLAENYVILEYFLTRNM